MKKILLGLALLLTANFVVGQEIKYGLKAGVNFAKMTASLEGISVSSSSIVLPHFHGILDYSFSPNFSLQPGIGVSGKGFKIKAGGEEVKASILYLDVPVNILGKIEVPSFGKLFIGGGPYLGINLSENIEYNGENFSGEENSYKTADFGLNVLGGVEFNNHFTLNANYGFGLVNIAKDSGGESDKNKVFTISIGYLF